MVKQEAIYVDHMGDDKRIVDVARISFGTLKRETTPEQDASLIRFLANGVTAKDKQEILDVIALGLNDVHYNNLEDAEDLYNQIKNQACHWTPFAHTAITLKMKAPIPIRTQSFKHKIGFVENEESRRYISSTPEIFIPEFRSKPEGSIKQGSGGTHKENSFWKGIYKESTDRAVATYLNMLDEGIAPEQARFILPQGAMVNWVWTGNLLAYVNFYNKRSDSHAQVEIQELAEMIKSVVEPLFPVSWKALTHGK